MPNLADIFTCGISVGVAPNQLFTSTLLIDSRTLYTSDLRTRPRSEAKCATIILNYLRDLQLLLRTSRIDAPTDLADVGPKHAGSLDILATFMNTGNFTLSIIGRRQSNEMKRKSLRADRKTRRSKTSEKDIYLVHENDRKLKPRSDE